MKPSGEDRRKPRICFVAHNAYGALACVDTGHIGGIAGAAVAVTLPLAIMNVIYLPFLVCRKVDLEVRRHFLSVLVGPTIHILPFAICLVVARLIFQNTPLMGIALGAAAGGAVLAVLY